MLFWRAVLEKILKNHYTGSTKCKIKRGLADKSPDFLSYCHLALSTLPETNHVSTSPSIVY